MKLTKFMGVALLATTLTIAFAFKPAVNNSAKKFTQQNFLLAAASKTTPHDPSVYSVYIGTIPPGIGTCNGSSFVCVIQTDLVYTSGTNSGKPQVDITGVTGSIGDWIDHVLATHSDAGKNDPHDANNVVFLRN